MLRAFATVAAPSSTFLGGGGPASGLPSHATAAPHAAMPHAGSACGAVSKDLIAYENQNEWSSATPRVNSAWAAALHEVGKLTVPSLSPSWAATGAQRNAQITRAAATTRMAAPPVCRTG